MRETETLGITLFFYLLLTFNSNAQTSSWHWAKEGVGSNTYEDNGWAVCTDAAGNVYQTGFFLSPTLTFGNITLVNADKTGNTTDIFFVKYDANGNVLWAQSAGGESNDYGLSLNTTASGDVYLSGGFESDSLTFGNITVTNTTQSINKVEDVFIVKYNSSGKALWAKATGGDSYSYALSSAIDAAGGVYITGPFSSPTISFGGFTLSNKNTNSSPDLFLVKYDSTGKEQWAKSAGGPNYDQSFSVCTDANYNVFLTGDFQSPSITFGNFTLTNPDTTGTFSVVFVAKFDSSGKTLWAKSSGGPSSGDEGCAVSADGLGNVYMAGYYAGASIIFGTTTLLNAVNTGHSLDGFIVKYDTAGNVRWAKSVGGSGFDYGRSLSIDLNNNVYFEGSTSSPSITFDLVTLYPSTGDFPVFLVQYDSGGRVLCATTLPSGGYDYEGERISTDHFGNVFEGANFGNQASPFIVGPDTLSGTASQTIFLAKYSCETISILNVNLITFTNTSCPGAHDGTATIVISGGVNPYSYKWNTNPAQTTETATGLSTGNYTVTVMDANSNSLIKSVTISQGAAINAGTITALRDTICAGTTCNLSVTGNSGNIQWQSDTTTGHFTTIPGAFNTTYSHVLNQSTYFRVMANRGACADSSNVVEIFVPPALTAFFTNTLAGYTANFNSSGSSGNIVSYNWNFGDSTTGNQPNPVHTYLKSDTFNVCLTIYDGSNCSYTYCEDVVTGNSSGIPLLTGQGKWNVYPDPFTDKFLISNNGADTKIEGIEMYDLLGRMVFNTSYEAQNSTVQVDASGLAEGVYYLEIKTDELNYLQPLIKLRIN